MNSIQPSGNQHAANAQSEATTVIYLRFRYIRHLFISGPLSNKYASAHVHLYITCLKRPQVDALARVYIGNVSGRFVGQHDVLGRISHFLCLLEELLKPLEMSYLIQNRPVFSCFKIKSACVHKRLVGGKTVRIIVQRWLSSSSSTNKRFKALRSSICIH